MRSLAGLVARQAAPALTRAYAGAVAPATSGSSPFLRFSNPYPTPVDHTPLLSTIPETRVRRGPGWRLRGGPNGGRRVRRGAAGRTG